MDQEQQDNIFDDPVWEYCVATKVKPYIEAVKKWWDQYERMQVRGTGVFDFEVEGMEQSRELMKHEANGKATKSAGRMPWHWEPMKDVINCDKPRGAVSTL